MPWLLARVGTPWPTIVERFRKPETTPDISVYWISTYYADPHNWVGEMFHSGNAGTFKNAHHYKNPKVDELLDKAVQSTKQDERAKLYGEAVKIGSGVPPLALMSDTAWVKPSLSLGALMPYSVNLSGRYHIVLLLLSLTMIPYSSPSTLPMSSRPGA